MNRVFLVAVVLLFPVLLSAQSRTVSGRLTGEDGLPLPQVTVLIKGTSTGTSTDADGYYSIYAPIGATLIFRFLGYGTQEVVVTADGLKPLKSGSKSEGNKEKRKARKLRKQEYQTSIFRDSLPTQESGMAILTEQSDRHKLDSKPDIDAIRSIKLNNGKHRLRIKKPYYYHYGSKYDLAYSTSFGIEHVGRLPALQSRFAQGRSQLLSNGLFWRGPEFNEIYSWGPEMSSLSFDGSDYAYDQNGRLASVGAGNATAASGYDPLNLFRTGFNQAHRLKLDLGGRGNGIGFDTEYRTRQGIFPGSEYERFNASLDVRKRFSDFIGLELKLAYNRSEGQLLNRGAQLATIIGGIYRTPVSFDNLNALSPESGLYDDAAYRLTDASNRSHAPSLVDNPVGVIQEFPNQSIGERYLAGLNLDFQVFNSLSITLKTDLDIQNNDTEFGISPGYTGNQGGIYTSRDHQKTYAFNQLLAQYNAQAGTPRFKAKAGLNTQYFKDDLIRIDASGFDNPSFYPSLGRANTLINNPIELNRTTFEPFLNAGINERNRYQIAVTNRAYFSNTLNSQDAFLFLPTVEAYVDFSRVIKYMFVEKLKLYFNLGRTVRESDLLYNDWAYGSLNTDLNDYSSFYEATELTNNNSLLAESEWKFETGIEFDLNYAIQAEFIYYRNRVDDFIAPVWSQGVPELTNVGSILNSGFTAILEFYGGYHPRWNTSLNFSIPNSRVLSLNSNGPIPLSGFTEVQSVLAEGEDVGSIYGSAYRRDADGNLELGFDGFPLKDRALRNLGSPIPDFTMSWAGEVNWKNIDFSFLVDMSYGGERWNGTQAMLDFLGRSQTTADERGLTQQFEGVDINGNPVTSVVTLYDPSLTIDRNRWVQYGPDGIGEEYIQDASWIRLQRLKISYPIPFKKTRWIRSFKVSAIGQNLFLITPYTGSDPTASLFGQANATGLDLFNMPSARSYALQLSIEIQ